VKARTWIGLAVVAALLVALGRPGGVVLLAVAATLAAQAARLAPERYAAVETGLVLAVGAVVSFLLLTPVFLIVFVLGWALVRLLGHDPLGATGRWSGRRRGRPRRLFADDRSATGSRLSARLGLALVALGLVAGLFLPSVFDDEDDGVPARLRGGEGLDLAGTAAMADASWLADATAEFDAAIVAGGTYDPFTAYALQDHEGDHVNVVDRERRSYEATTLDDQPALDVWFFGGSTMFGVAAQRDEHTIASEVVRLAEEDGVRVEAHNFGSPGMVNYQETLLFARLLAARPTPDLVVFYDGINDRAVQFLHAYAGTGTVGEPDELVAFDYREALVGEVTGTDEPPPPIGTAPTTGDQPPPVEDVVQAIVDVYGQGVDLGRLLGQDDGVPVRHFWQPDLYSKAELDPGEEALLAPLHLDDRRFEAQADLAAEVRSRLPDEVVDLSAAWDGADGPILNDQVHTNELGARLVAEAMYEHLRPELLRLADEADR
jgi:hypothetical protein